MSKTLVPNTGTGWSTWLVEFDSERWFMSQCIITKTEALPSDKQ